MSSTLFDRKYELIFGHNVQRGTSQSSGLLIRDLRITFKVEKTLESIPNSMVLEIYNLSKSSRSIIEEEFEKYSKLVGEARTTYPPNIFLNAGYGLNLKNIFTGNSAFVHHRQIGADIITTVECGDGESAFAAARLEKSFAPGVSVGTVIQDLKTALGLNAGQIKGLNENDTFPNGLTLSGPVKNHLDLIAERQGLEWSIQNGQLQMLPVALPTDEEVILLNSQTGLIGTPQKIKMVNQSTLIIKDGVNAQSGIIANALLNGDIRPGRRIKVESKFFQGEVFKLRKCIYEGDTHSNKWFTGIEGASI